MASILDRYGIKEVADVTFYKLDNAGVPMYPVLYLDTLKVSTIEQTAESAEARGGKGNPALISWDYNKEINVTLEDALFSAKSMAIMFGNGTPLTTGDSALIMKTEVFTYTGTQRVAISSAEDTTAKTIEGWNPYFTAPDGKKYKKLNPKFYEEGTDHTARDGGKNTINLEPNTKYFCSYDLQVVGSVIDVSANSFPGTYYVTGDTYARNDASGADEFFQFIIPKAKVTSENTITMEAEGDPSVFSMSLKVLRPADGVMMKLVKYNLKGGETEESGATVATLIHNHALDDENNGAAGSAATNNKFPGNS